MGGALGPSAACAMLLGGCLPFAGVSAVPEEGEWQVGGRYGLRRCARHVLLREGPAPQDSVTCEMGTGETVLLLQISGTPGWGRVAGLVVPAYPNTPGWITLEDPPRPSVVVRRRLKGSWEMRARYVVRHPATVRTNPELLSEQLCEVEPGEEVLALQLALCGTAPHRDARLRMQVSTQAKIIGWLSPETVRGDQLLYPVNLLGPEVVRLHRHSLSARRARVNAGGTSDEGQWALLEEITGGAAGARQSFQVGAEAPWIVGGRYRVLEHLPLREQPALSSAEIGRVAAGALVTVEEICHMECQQLRRCPCAFVRIEEGREAGCRGWLRCSARDGHDLVDTRNQNECDEILEKLSRHGTSALVTGRPSSREHGAGGGAAGGANPGAPGAVDEVVLGVPNYAVGRPVRGDEAYWELAQVQAISGAAGGAAAGPTAPGGPGPSAEAALSAPGAGGPAAAPPAEPGAVPPPEAPAAPHGALHSGTEHGTSGSLEGCEVLHL